MFTVRSLSAATLLVTAAVTGCAAQTADEPGKGGLTLTTNTAHLVAGTARRDGVELTFESAVDGANKHVVVQAKDGIEILRVSSDASGTTTSILDSRFVVVVPREGAPSIKGDPKATEELKARPEYALAKDLSGMLAEAGVDPGLVDPMVAPKRAPQRDYEPSEEYGGGGGRGGCGIWEELGCAAWITTCSGACAVGTAGTGLAVCMGACLATTVAGCEKCL
jgi:hypothetical protein